MTSNTEPRPSGRMPSEAHTTSVVAIALVGAAFGIAAVAESAATASPDNCGELPGIARTGTMVIGVGIAIVIVVLGAIGAAIAKRGSVLGLAGAVGAGIVAGLFVGSAVTPRNPCGSDEPMPTRQAATLRLTLGPPYSSRVEGPGECRRPSPGADVQEVVSDLAAVSRWVIDNGAVRVDLEVYPTGRSPYPGADSVRVFLGRPGSGFGIYGDGDGTELAKVQITSAGGATGRVSFSALPPWSDNRPAASLPPTLDGVIEWTCSGPEE